MKDSRPVIAVITPARASEVRGGESRPSAPLSRYRNHSRSALEQALPELYGVLWRRGLIDDSWTGVE